MGYPRPRPHYLSHKLLRIRLHAGLSQSELAKAIGVKAYNDISKYELNRNEPPLSVVLAYSRLAGVRVEDIIDDDLNLEF